jgi:D-erythro-7,8-dihydroneopterin triphosphate epimerase
MDAIYIRDILLRCIIGVYEEERREKQDVVINIKLSADLSEAGRTDDLSKTVDYKAVKQSIVKLVEGSAFLLVETLAERIAQVCLDASECIEAVEVLVEKPGALRFARTVGVEIRRERSAK